ncbi:aspartic peptidase A1 [Collybia nuda]|uniref:Aspartic peptidase A1 n=1 Tax=Collybia nuda TaxID=64659 RepID=A0A9P5Y5H3_9AGAR|nr:aspartic peptidase A1 [Collybia nuda]
MLSLFPVSLTLVVSFVLSALAVPSSSLPNGQSIPLQRKTRPSRTMDEWGEWAKAHRDMLAKKYGPGQPQKRGAGTNLITNQNSDSSFFGSLAIGTPPVSYNVILDTGSSDLWVAASNCTVGCSGVPTFNPTASSTFVSNGAAFKISYGSGEAAGTLGEDTVQMAGFSVSNQTFAACDVVSSGLLSSPVSGLLGLAFRSIASSGATPLWEALVSNGAWDSPLMAFQYLDDPTAQSLEPGGSFNLGFVNTTLFTGDIEYVEMPTRASYWILPMTSLTVQGTSVALPSGSEAYSAIDTGTTLVGGPSEYMNALYSLIPGASPGSGNFEGYYTYPCDTAINVTVAFGGKNWPISAADFRLTRLTRDTCLGAFFDLTTGRSAPSWIVGDTFLKNVYSVFRYDPPSIGFAELSSTALALNGADGPVPTPTIGSAAATVTATGRGRPSQSAATGLENNLLIALTFVWTIILFSGIQL